MSVSLPSTYAECIPTTWLAERLAVDPAKIDLQRRAGELIAVRKPGTIEWLYPAWQFDSWEPRPGVRRVVAAAREAGVDEQRLYEILTAPLGLTKGNAERRLSDLLAEGRDDDVVAAIRAA